MNDGTYYHDTNAGDDACQRLPKILAVSVSSQLKPQTHNVEHKIPQAISEIG